MYLCKVIQEKWADNEKVKKVVWVYSILVA